MQPSEMIRLELRPEQVSWLDPSAGNKDFTAAHSLFPPYQWDGEKNGQKLKLMA